jgi:alkylhydroperoxidase/carboxymuconolactone decarboxylase family protein YurZ
VKRHFADAKQAGATDAELREIIAGVMMVGAARIRHFAVDNLEGLTLEEKTE